MIEISTEYPGWKRNINQTHDDDCPQLSCLPEGGGSREKEEDEGDKKKETPTPGANAPTYSTRSNMRNHGRELQKYERSFGRVVL